MNLRQLINSIASTEYEAADANGVVAILNAQSVDVRDTSRWNAADIASVIGPADTSAVLSTVGALPDLDWAPAQLTGEGIRFNDDAAWPILTILEATIPSIANVKALIRSTTSPSQKELGKDTTVAEVQALLLKDQKDALTTVAQDRLTNYNVALSNWDGTGDPPEL